MTHQLTQQNILVVDDEAPMRRLLCSNLKASGYAVRSAADGAEALKLIDEHRFDLALLDINMPGPNGLQVLEAMRRGAQMPILMVSGRGRERDKVAALDLGADDYISKPFGVAELLARVKALLRRVAPDYVDRYHRIAIRDWRLTSTLASRELAEFTFLRLGASSKCWHIWHVMQARSSCIGRCSRQSGGGEYGEESDYVWTYVQRIRRKIEPDRAHPRYVPTDAGVGYRMTMPEEGYPAM